ncbi:NADH-quinone oxidoreductase subunit L [bacterium]|nr:NADH-quinone oxidoreductase subunit L [bacterium]
METLLILLIIAPFLGSAINGLVWRTQSATKAGMLATSAVAISFVSALVLFVTMNPTTPVELVWPWLEVGSFKVNWGFRFDVLTSVMALVVTGIGTLIHLYSIGYMSHEEGAYRYFSYLNLFVFLMLVLICSGNLLTLFVGWEGVGLCSYLLIGYWYQDPEKAKAGMKAFVVNRIGDAGFLLGMFFCYQLFGSLDFQQINHAIDTQSNIDVHLMNLAALFLFIGATGKSAQLPLYVWLPDAMAGPTPVSALIHAATMVTSGIYLIARLEPLFVTTAATNQVIAIVGLSTALLAALIATSQRDIKKVLAYSTVSQLGLMVLALGCQAYVAALFHLVTHACFKALLFLGSGSVIHGLEGEQDIYQMGGLRKQMPITHWTFLVGTLAIAGIPPLAGFFSKDTILHAALVRDNRLWIGGALVATLTAFYMFRLYALTFLGSYRGKQHAHESPWIMTVPLTLLALASAVVGFLGVPHEFHWIPNFFEDYLKPVIPLFTSTDAPTTPSAHEAMAITTTLALVASGVAVLVFRKRTGSFGTLFVNKFWIDELYGILIVRPFEMISEVFSSVIDPKVIDGGITTLSKSAKSLGSAIVLFQTGNIQWYLLVMLLGLVLSLGWILKGGIL